MNKSDLNQRSQDNHAEIAELIPWYSKGTLSADEQGIVSGHLEDCERCRQALAECKTIAETSPSAETEWKPSSAHFNRVLAALDALEANEKPAVVALSNEKPVEMKKPNKPGFFQRLVALISQTPALLRWTLAVETLAIAGIIGFLVLPNHISPFNTTGFETLSNAEPVDRKVANVVRVVFNADMSVKELSDLLKEAHAQVRQGPSTVGAFTVEVAKDNVPQSMETFRSNKNVRLVLLMDQSSGE
jgi:hypothetical protein